MTAAFITAMTSFFKMFGNLFATGEELSAAARRAAEVTNKQVGHWGDLKEAENKAEFKAKQAQLKLLDIE